MLPFNLKEQLYDSEEEEMRFRATMTFEYQVSKADMEKNYGTSDPIEAARIDQAAMEEDPGVFLEGFGEEIIVNVEPIS